MKCLAFPNKPCDLLTCHTKKKCLWTEEELRQERQELKDPFEVLDALRGSISGEYEHDLICLNVGGKTCSREVYQQAYQMDQQS